MMELDNGTDEDDDENMGLDAPDLDAHIDMLESNINNEGMDELYVQETEDKKMR